MTSKEERRDLSLKMHQNALLLTLRDDMVWENFYPVGNESVLNDLQTNIATPAYAGICLQGGQSTGKTHLLQGAVHAALAQGRSAAYLPLGRFKEYGPQSVAGFMSHDWLVMDDIDHLAGDNEWEIALFELINRAWSGECHVLYSASVRVQDAGWSIPDLASRLGWGLVCTLHDLDDEQKTEWLMFRAKRRAIEMPEPVAQYLIKRYSRDITKLYELIVKLDEMSLQAQRKLTLPFVKSVIDVIIG